MNDSLYDNDISIIIDRTCMYLVLIIFSKWWAGLSISGLVLLTSIIVTFCISLKNKFAASLPGEMIHPGPQ